MRKLASIKRIDKIKEHTNADALELAVIGGWQSVVKKGEFKEGDVVVYLEIDSWVPHDIAPFLSKGKEPREYNGVKGERLRTIRLRGELSQGLILPLSSFDYHTEMRNRYFFEPPSIGDDLTEVLGIQKWEKPIPASLSGQVRGNFPSFIKKTDQERFQNIDLSKYIGEEVEVTLKLDGSSMTIYGYTDTETGDRVVGVCSRNNDLKLEQEGNTFVDTAKKTGLLDWLKSVDYDIAIQGELMGEGVQGNRENIKGHQFFIFDIWDINTQTHLTPAERINMWSREIANTENRTLNHVPVIGRLTIDIHTDIQYFLSIAEGLSLHNDVREGLVFKDVKGKFSFKAISNTFLEGEK